MDIKYGAATAAPFMLVYVRGKDSLISRVSPIIAADTCPPMRSISSRTMERPRPAPPFARAGLL